MTPTIAVLDADQLRQIVREKVIRALDDLRAIFHAAAEDAAAVRSPHALLGDALITSKALAETTGIAERELRRLAHEGLFPAPIRLGVRRIRWKRKEVLDWMAQAPRTTPARVRIPPRCR